MWVAKLKCPSCKSMLVIETDNPDDDQHAEALHEFLKKHKRICRFKLSIAKHTIIIECPADTD